MRPGRLTLFVLAATACGTPGTETVASGSCELQLEPGVRFELADGARIPDPAKTVVRDTRGFFYTASTPGGRIAVFSPEGSFLRTIGRPGKGPGEIGAGRYNAIMIHSDTLYVTRPVAYDLFDTAGTFIRRLNAPSIPTLLAQAIQLTSDGEILTGTQDPNLRNFFAVLSRDGSSKRTFGPMNEMDKQFGKTLGAIRVIAYDGKDSFWAGPPTYYPEGLKLEKWSVSSGHMIDSIRLDVPWYPPGKKGSEGSHRITVLHIDTTGTLFLVAMRPRESGIHPRQMTVSAPKRSTRYSLSSTPKRNS